MYKDTYILVGLSFEINCNLLLAALLAAILLSAAMLALLAAVLCWWHGYGCDYSVQISHQ